MRPVLTSWPSGLPGRQQEDRARASDDAVLVVDGAGVPARFRAGCHHSVAWYAEHLADALAARVTGPDPLPQVLAGAIAAVRDEHAGTCDLGAGSPSATVAIARTRGDVLEHLVLCDASVLLLQRDGTAVEVTDPALDHLAARLRSDRPAGVPLADAVEARRNRPGGFWVARHEPEAAAHALTGTTPLADLAGVALTSDGATRGVHVLGIHVVDDLARRLIAGEHEAVLAEIRAAEIAARPPGKQHDDATVVSATL